MPSAMLRICSCLRKNQETCPEPDQHHSQGLKLGDIIKPDPFDAILNSIVDPGSSLPGRRISVVTPGTLKDEFRVETMLGRGGFGEVWLATYRGKKRGSLTNQVVIKLQRRGTSLSMVINEVHILMELRGCQYVAHIEGWFATTLYYGIVMKLASRGSLHAKVKGVRCLSEENTRMYAAQMAIALFQLHQRGIIHRDLNLDNVLLQDNGDVAVSDFGLSLMLRPDEMKNLQPPWSEGAGQPQFPAPEVFLGHVYDKTVDWWSYGVILYRMLVGGFPFVRRWDRRRDSNAYNLDLVCRPEDYPASMSEPCHALLVGLLARRSERRLGHGRREAQDIMGSLFFKTVEWDLYPFLASPFTVRRVKEAPVRHSVSFEEFSMVDQTQEISPKESTQQGMQDKKAKKSNSSTSSSAHSTTSSTI